MQMLIDNRNPKAGHSNKVYWKENISIATLKEFTDSAVFAAADRPSIHVNCNL